MFKYVPAFLMSILVSGLAIGSATADHRYEMCIGEVEHDCGFSHQAMFGCGTTADDVARAVCSITNPDGSKKYGPYRLILRGATSGDHCGYAGYFVDCVE